MTAATPRRRVRGYGLGTVDTVLSVDAVERAAAELGAGGPSVADLDALVQGAPLLAIDGLVASGKLERSPLRDSVAAVSVGIISGEPRLDLDYSEDSAASVDMNIVMTGDGRFVEVQGTAEDEPFTDAELDALRELGRLGCRELTVLQQAARRPA